MSAGAPATPPAPRASVFASRIGGRVGELIAHILGEPVRTIAPEDAPAGGVAVLAGIDDDADGDAGAAMDAAILRHLLARPADAPLVIGIGDARAAGIAREVALAGRGGALTKVAPGACMDRSRWPGLQGEDDALVALCAIAACEALGVDRSVIDKGLESHHTDAWMGART